MEVIRANKNEEYKDVKLELVQALAVLCVLSGNPKESYHYVCEELAKCINNEIGKDHET